MRSLLKWSMMAGILPLGLSLVYTGSFCSPVWKLRYLVSYVRPSSSRTTATFLVIVSGRTWRARVRRWETHQPFGDVLWEKSVNCLPWDIVSMKCGVAKCDREG